MAPEPETAEDVEPDVGEDVEPDLGLTPGPVVDVRRRATQMFGGVLLCGVVIALCVVALVVLADRFFAPLQK